LFHKKEKESVLVESKRQVEQEAIKTHKGLLKRKTSHWLSGGEDPIRGGSEVVRQQPGIEEKYC
jgi:hypothetical protein